MIFFRLDHLQSSNQTKAIGKCNSEKEISHEPEFTSPKKYTAYKLS